MIKHIVKDPKAEKQEKKMCKGLVLFGFVSHRNFQNRSYPGGVLPIMAYTGRLRPKGVPFLGFSYMHFMAVKKSIKCSGVVVYSYFKGQCIELDM